MVAKLSIDIIYNIDSVLGFGKPKQKAHLIRTIKSKN